jgi:ABC-type multidrug transport system fused ATPase/permease subunit
LNKLAKNTKDNERKISAMNIRGKIELRNAYYSYPTRPDQVILKDVSFTVYPRTIISFSRIFWKW